MSPACHTDMDWGYVLSMGLPKCSFCMLFRTTMLFSYTRTQKDRALFMIWTRDWNFHAAFLCMQMRLCVMTPSWRINFTGLYSSVKILLFYFVI